MAGLDYIAVQCFQCQMFQVQRGGKKVAKFNCKACGAKQSVQAVHGRSCRAADVRGVVSALNARRADGAAHADAAQLRRAEQRAEMAVLEDEEGWDAERDAGAPPAQTGRWNDYLDGEEEVRAGGDAALDPPPAHAGAKRSWGAVARGGGNFDNPARRPLPTHAAAAPSGGGAQQQQQQQQPQQQQQQQQQRPPQAGTRWSEPAPLSPRRANVAAAAPAPSGKWGAFGEPEQDDW